MDDPAHVSSPEPGPRPGPGRSLTVDLGGDLHYVDFGGPAGRPALVLVHGLGGSHLNWDLVAPALARRYRVLAVDLPGFGLTAPGTRLTTVPENVRLLERFSDTVVGGPAVVVGNSMGGMIGILMADRSPQRVTGLVLVDPALPPVPALPRGEAAVLLHLLPGLGEYLTAARRRRIGPRATVVGMLRLCGVDPATVPTELLDRSVALVARRRDVAGVDRAFLTAARSLAWVLVRAGEYRAAMAAVRVPVLLLHGDRDLLVPVAAARAAAARNPAWTYRELAGVGHVPQLQVPEVFTTEVLGWLADHEPGTEGGRAGSPSAL
ncbi:alpha/beta hydrolase [Pseudonocardia xishanensis]|uniref:Alpha/beta fold hydrolase n=1 Tax=Pseudonocardia xishanensis TaxID=630995 RepID=A0ABP8RSG1_9PSEU